MNQLKGFDKAFREYFSVIKPACTLIGINSLVQEGLLIEIGCLAIKEELV